VKYLCDTFSGAAYNAVGLGKLARSIYFYSMKQTEILPEIPPEFPLKGRNSHEMVD